MPTREAFVGRAQELAVLQGELQRVMAGEPRLVWLSGEAGIGKTSLVRCFVDRLSGVRVLLASGDEAEADLSYGVLTQLVADVQADGALEELGADTDPLAVGAAFLAGLGNLDAQQPVVLVVDDAQWADRRSAQALVFVLRRLRRDRVLVLLSARSEAPSGQLWDRALAQSHLTTRLTLRGLTPDDLRRLGPTADGVTLSAAASRRLHDHTAGHPLHALALLDELPAEALLAPSGILPAPHSLGTVVLVRLSKLSPLAQALVLAVAVLGTRCARTDAIRVADVADPLAALDEAVRAGLLVENPPGHPRDVGFPHVLIRSALYADLAPARRHALHARAAEVLGGVRALGHRVAAATGPDAELADELERVGRQEMAEQDWPGAAEHLLAASDLSPDAVARGRRLVDAVAAILADGDLARAIGWEPAVRETPASAARSAVLGQVALYSGRLSTAREEFSTALRLGAETGSDFTERAAVAAYSSLLSMIEGEVEVAVDLAVEALLARPSAVVAAPARFALVLSLASQGRQEELFTLLDAADTAGLRPEGTGERQALAGLLALWSGHDRAAVAALSEALRQGPPGRLVQGRILLLTSQAEALYRVGDWDGAASSAELATSLAEDGDIRLGLAVFHAVSSFVASGRGLWDVAEAHVAEATRAAQTHPWWASRGYAAHAQATLAQARGDFRAMRHALRVFDDPLVRERSDGLGSFRWRALLVEALLGLGQLDEAEAALQELSARTAERPGSSTASEECRLQAQLAETRGAESAARQAYERGLRVAGDRDLSLSRARLETAYARFLLTCGERRPAVDLLRSARDSLTRLGARPFLSECERLLHAAGLRPAAQGAPLDFTTQEIAVARLVAAGRTNSEVGGELFITSRTVAYHLSNIYAKVGISSRRDLANLLPELLS